MSDWVSSMTVSQLKKEDKIRFNKETEERKYTFIGIRGGKGGYWIAFLYLNKLTAIESFQITFCKCHATGGGVDYKHIDADMHPYYFDCPIEWVNRFQPEIGSYGKEWKEKCLSIHNFKANFKFGKVYKFNSMKDDYYRIEYNYSTKYYLGINKDGTKYKIEKTCIDDTFPGQDTFPA